MQIQKINSNKNTDYRLGNLQNHPTNCISKPNMAADTVSFRSKALKPNQVLPATEVLIQRAIQKTKVEKKKILAALNKTWESFAMGKASNIYIGHREIPLDRNKVDWLHQSIQLTGNLPGNKRVYFCEVEPDNFLLHVDPIKNTHNTKDVIYEIDYRADKEGKITEFNPEYGGESTDPEKVKTLNERLQYCLKALFPRKITK